MAQSEDYTPIKLYSSETADELPAAGKLEVGEVAVNIADAKLYTKNSSEEIVELSGGNNHEHESVDITDLESTVNVYLETALRPTVETISDTGFTLAASQESSVVLCTAATAVTVTAPNNTETSIPIGYIIHLHQANGGQVTVVGAAGVTVSSAISLSTRTQYSSISLIKSATNNWILIGDQAL